MEIVKLHELKNRAECLAGINDSVTRLRKTGKRSEVSLLLKRIDDFVKRLKEIGNEEYDRDAGFDTRPDGVR